MKYICKTISRLFVCIYCVTNIGNPILKKRSRLCDEARSFGQIEFYETIYLAFLDAQHAGFSFFKCSLFVVGPHRHKNIHRPTVPTHQPIQINTPRKPLNILKWFLDFSYRSMSVKRGVGYLRSKKPGDCHDTLLSCSLVNTNDSSRNFQRLRWHIWQFKIGRASCRERV